MNTAPTPTKAVKAPTRNRRNIYTRNPHIFDAFSMAIEKGIIRSRSASERIEELLGAELRRVAPKLRKAGVQIPEGVFKK